MIAFIPADSENTASARIRAFALCKAMRSLGYDARIGSESEAAILVVQKRVTDEVLDVTWRARQRGVRIVYDVDDLGEALWWWAPKPQFLDMIGLADLVLVSNDDQRVAIEAQFAPAACGVLAGAADYDPEEPAELAELPSDVLRIAWFGNNSNFDLFRKYVDLLATLHDAQPVVIVDSDAAADHARTFPHVEFHAWQRDTFVQTLRTCHISCLSHDGNPADRSKSNTRFVTSVVWGVPAIVSRTPEYARTAVELGVPEALFDDPADLVRAVEAVRHSDDRRAYLAVAQPAAWAGYSPLAIARRFVELLEAHFGVFKSELR